MPATAVQSPVSSIKILSLQMEMRKLNSEVEFVLVLAGKVRLEREHDVLYMNQNDVVLIRPNEFPVFNASGNNLILIITIKKDFFVRNGVSAMEQFVCNSVNDEDHEYSELRKILSRIAITHFDRSQGDDIYQIELCYSLVHYLTRYHQHENGSLPKIRVDSSRRKDMIMDYMEQNYMNPLTLTELAELTHLNSSYLSRFFRKMTGGTFNKCLKNIRLEHALNDLKETDKSVTSIAYENGFSTPAAFCKVFAAEYGITPSQFRKSDNSIRNMKTMTDPGNESVQSVDYEEVEAELQSLASKSPESDAGAVKYPFSRQFTVENATLSTWIRPLWGKLINLGFGINLKNSEFQNQLHMLQNEIGFEYGRVEGLMNKEVLPDLQNGEYNFSDFDRIILTMLSNNLKPYIDLSVRGANILLPGRDEVLYRYYEPRSKAESFLEKLEVLIRHCVNFFGSDEVNTWIFDIGIFHDEYLQLKETPKEFARRAKASMEIIRRYLQGALVGGISFNSGMPAGTWESIIRECSQEGFRPDFLSTCIFPYEPVADLRANLRLVSTDPNHVRNEILREKSIIERYPEITQSLWLVAMGVSIQTMDYVNDTCFQATYFIKNTIDILGLVEAVGYYQLSDISEEYYDTPRILYGASGILSRNSLKKPGFSALKRLMQADSRLLAKDDCFLVTTNGSNIYHVILCNYSYFNELYCVSGAKGMSDVNAYDSFTEPETQAVVISLNGLRPGKYKIVCSLLSREYGSLFDEWLRYGILDDLQLNDIQYLRDTVHPHRTAHYTECEDGSLLINTQLLPHETKFYEITRII